MRKYLIALPAILAAGALSLGAAATASAATTVVAKHLNNPRQVAIDAQGNLYVAEAGKAGRTCPSKDTCLGLTSSIAKIPAGGGSVQRIATGFPSGGSKDGSFGTGIDGVSVAPDGTVFGVVTSAPPSLRKHLPASFRRRLGILFSVPAAGGSPTKVAQIDALELKNNYDKADVNPNPYAVLALASDHQVVVDAGANTVYDVQGGQATLLALLPKVGGAQRVPLSIALGPDGAYYVGELPGEGKKSKPHGARILRIAPGPAPVTPTVFATGLDGVAGLAFGPDGSLYATEQATNPRSQKSTGALVKFSPDGSQRTVLAKRLGFPGGVAVGPDGSAYVANYSVLPGTTPKKSPFKGLGGQVVKITP